MLFLVQIQDVTKFKIAKDIDSDYYNNFIDANKKGLNFVAYRCKLNPKEIIMKKIRIDMTKYKEKFGNRIAGNLASKTLDMLIN